MRKTSQEGKIDDVDSGKPRNSTQGESNGYRQRNAKDRFNKLEGKENSKDTTNKATSSPVSDLYICNDTFLSAKERAQQIILDTVVHIR